MPKIISPTIPQLSILMPREPERLHIMPVSAVGCKRKNDVLPARITVDADDALVRRITGDDKSRRPEQVFVIVVDQRPLIVGGNY
jgi:hypothetical protein